MKKEEAEKVVAGISAIAEGEATITMNRFCENAADADHNRRIVESWKRDLIELLTKEIN